MIKRPMLFREEDDGGSGGPPEAAHVPQSAEFKNFASRFSAKNAAPVGEGGDPDSKPTRDAIDAMKADSERQAANREQQKSEGEKLKQDQPKKPGSNVPQIIEAKRAAERERDELKTKASEYEAKITEYEKKAADLQAKIDSGELSPKKEAEFQQRIIQLEEKAQQDRESLVNENQKLKQRVAFHDLNESDDFKKEYIEPVITTMRAAQQILGSDKAKHAALQRATIANAAALRAETAEERAAAEDERDSLLDGIVQSMDGFKGKRFVEAITQYISGTVRHRDALNDHEKTTAELRVKTKQERERAYAQQLETWGKVFNSTADKYKEDAMLSEDELKVVEELGIDLEKDLKKHEVTAKKSIFGDGDIGEAIDIIHKGRIYPALKAKNQVLEKRLKDAQSLIQKLRGGGTGNNETGGGSAGGSNGGAKKETREEWQARRFGASRLA